MKMSAQANAKTSNQPSNQPTRRGREPEKWKNETAIRAAEAELRRIVDACNSNQPYKRGVCNQIQLQEYSGALLKLRALLLDDPNAEFDFDPIERYVEVYAEGGRVYMPNREALRDAV